MTIAYVDRMICQYFIKEERKVFQEFLKKICWILFIFKTKDFLIQSIVCNVLVPFSKVQLLFYFFKFLGPSYLLTFFFISISGISHQLLKITHFNFSFLIQVSSFLNLIKKSQSLLTGVKKKKMFLANWDLAIKFFLLGSKTEI